MLTEATDLPLGPADAAAPPAGRLRPGVRSRAVLTVLFTGVQVWAITITITVRYVHAGVVERAALAAALAAAALAVLDAWREVWAATAGRVPTGRS